MNFFANEAVAVAAVIVIITAYINRYNEKRMHGTSKNAIMKGKEDEAEEKNNHIHIVMHYKFIRNRRK